MSASDAFERHKLDGCKVPRAAAHQPNQMLRSRHSAAEKTWGRANRLAGDRVRAPSLQVRRTKVGGGLQGRPVEDCEPL